MSGNTIAHHVNTTEIYCMLDGAGTLVTGGTVMDQNDSGTRGAAIAGGVTRRIVPGDVVTIPGHTPHWWSELESDIECLIFRLDPKPLQLR